MKKILTSLILAATVVLGASTFKAIPFSESSPGPYPSEMVDKMKFTYIKPTGFRIVPYIGIAMNGNLKGAHSESYMHSESPLGIFGVDIEYKYVSVGYRHISSIPQMDETQGINEIVAKATYRGLYVGVAYNNDTLTSQYYLDQISEYSVLVGVQAEYSDDKYLFIEYRDSNDGKKDAFMFGAGFNFDSSKLLNFR